MNKTILLLILSFGACYFAQAQVGINTKTPYSTLHVLKDPSGTAPDGIIAPNLKLSELIARDALYGPNQTGAFVYITNIDAVGASKTLDIVVPGYYYFDGTVWKHFNDKLQIANNGLSVGANANVQLGGDLLKNTTIDTHNKLLTIQNTGGTDTGLQLVQGNPSVGSIIKAKDTSGNLEWGIPGFSKFERINGGTVKVNYPAVNPAIGYVVVYSGISIPLGSTGTFLITIGMTIGNTIGGLKHAVQLMPTNVPANWESHTSRYAGSYEAYELNGRIYYSQVVTVEPGQSTTAYLMIAIVGSQSANPTTDYVVLSYGELPASAPQPQVAGGSYLKIN